jgi:hypothetical protein
MQQLIVRNIIDPNGREKGRCLACGVFLGNARRKYCSMECRKRLLYKLEVRTGLIKALNTKYATFYFSDVMIVMDMLPYGSEEIFSFFYPRSPGKKPAEDFSTMADMLGNIWWTERKRTNKRYLASHHVLDQAVRNNAPVVSVKPTIVKLPSLKATHLSHLKLDKSALNAVELQQNIKNAYRRQAKMHHPDIGGDAATFRKIHQAYRELTTWAKKPAFVKRRGFPDKWFYDGSTNKWVHPQVQR